jgi:hypothetical protein
LTFKIFPTRKIFSQNEHGSFSRVEISRGEKCITPAKIGLGLALTGAVTGRCQREAGFFPTDAKYG